MKNLTRLFYFGGTLILLILLMIPFVSHAQEAGAAASSGGFLGKFKFLVSETFWTTIIGIVGGILANKGWTKKIKSAAYKSSIVLKDFGNVLSHAGGVMEQASESIRDDDSVDAKGMLDAIKQSKTVYIEGKDAVIRITPKK
jgi:hypothetical protein